MDGQRRRAPARPRKQPGQYPLIRRFLAELEWSEARKYVEQLRQRGELLELDGVDVDVPQLVRRHFVCDARRCLQWADDGRALLDRSCCCRYGVPVTTADRIAVTAHLDEVRPLLPPGHRLLDPAADPFQSDDDLGLEMVHDNPLGGCQFNLYQDGRCRCAIHAAALAAGADPARWKPLACSLWPLALASHSADAGAAGEERLLLTIYCEETNALFDETDDDPFACLVDQDPSYPRTYQAERATLEHLFGAGWWRKLDAAARRILAAEERSARPRR